MGANGESFNHETMAVGKSQRHSLIGPVQRIRTQADAIDRARQILTNDGGEELTKSRDGKIRDSDTGPSGNDPNPPCDKR